MLTVDKLFKAIKQQNCKIAFCCFLKLSKSGICSNSFCVRIAQVNGWRKMYIFSIIAYSNKWSGIPTLQKENSFKSQIKNYTTIALVKLQKQSITKTAKKNLSQKPEARYSSVAFHSGWKSQKMSHFNFLWQIK